MSGPMTSHRKYDKDFERNQSFMLHITILKSMLVQKNKDCHIISLGKTIITNRCEEMLAVFERRELQRIYGPIGYCTV